MNGLVVDDDILALHLIEAYGNKTQLFKNIFVCQNSHTAIEVLNNHPIDVIFLDIELSEMTGFEFLNTIKSNLPVIFITAHKKFALHAFQFNVVDYLVKPVTYLQFVQAVIKAKKHFVNSSITTGTPEIFIKNNSILNKLTVTNILFIEAASDYIFIYTDEKKRIVNCSMQEIIKRLPKKEFIRVHRSYIVCLKSIEQINGNMIKIKNHVIPISKSYKKQLLNSLNIV